MQTRKSHRFITKVEVTKDQLKELLDRVAMRSYERGYRDGLAGRPKDPSQCKVSEKSLCKIR